MKQTTIPIKPDARVLIKCSDDLSIEGNDSSTLVVIVEQGDCLRMKEENGLYRIVSDSDCRILLPASATVTVEKTGGDCQISNLSGRVIVGKIGDNLQMKNISGASVESVGCDCWIQDTSGAVELARIGDDLKVDGAQSILANSVGGDVHLKNIHGKVDVSAGDEIHIYAAEPNLPEINAKAGSDIELYISRDANCELKLISGGEDISLHACGQDVDLEDREFSVPLGNGGAMVLLTAGDGIRVTDKEAPDWQEDEKDWSNERWKDFGFDITQRVKNSLKGVEVSVENAIQQAESATRKAGRHVERVFRELDEHGINTGHHRKVVGFSMGEEKSAPSNPKSGPTDEERMLVLKMLQEKKITVEEAEKLLTALDR